MRKVCVFAVVMILCVSFSLLAFCESNEGDYRSSLLLTNWTASEYIRNAKWIEPFVEGFAAVHGEAPSTKAPKLPSGFIDTAGNVYTMEYSNEVSSFQSGFGRFRWSEGSFPCVGLLNTEGKLVYGIVRRDKNNKYPDHIDFESIGEFSNGVAIAKTHTNSYHLLSEAGSILTDEDCARIGGLSDGLRSFSYNGPSGYMDNSGNVVIEPQFYQVTDFSNGYAAVRKSKTGKWGMIDKEGNVVLPFEYWFIGSFSEGLCAISKKSYNYGFVDTSLNLVIDYQFYNVYDFKGDCAIIQTKNGKRGCIDTQGNIIIPCEWDYLESIDDNGRIRARRDGQYYLMDQNGSIVGNRGWKYISSIVATPNFPSFSDSDEQLPYYVVEDYSGKHIIDVWGEIVNDAFQGTDSVKMLSDDLLLWQYRESSQYVITDRNLHILGNREWQNAHIFDNGTIKYLSEDMIVISDSNGLGFMDVEGNIDIAPQYYSVTNFSESYAAVRDTLYSNYYYIKKDGNRAFNGEFSYAGDFHNGLAKVMISDGSYYGYINTEGIMQIEARWERCTDFCMGYAFVEDSTGWYMIDVNGNVIF